MMLELDCRRQPTPRDLRILRLHRDHWGRLWALATRGASSLLLRKHETEWETVAPPTDIPLIDLCVLASGRVLAASDRGICALSEPDWSHTIVAGRLSRIWAGGGNEAYAIGGTPGSLDRLFFFDGSAWTPVDRVGIEGYFADGDGSEHGDQWVVGVSGTHSCMARGRGTRWERDGCGDYSLHRVRVFSDNEALAAGYQLWHRAGGDWVELPNGANSPVRIHLWLGRVGQDDVFVEAGYGEPGQELLDSALEAAGDRKFPRLRAYRGGTWHTREIPAALRAAGIGEVTMLDDGRLLMTTLDGALWETGNFFGE